MKYLYIYLLIINLVAFIIMLIDKRKAIKGKWRIPEKNIFTLAIIGGSIGVLLGIYSFRHKTKHLSFTIGIPVILILQIAGIIYFVI